MAQKVTKTVAVNFIVTAYLKVTVDADGEEAVEDLDERIVQTALDARPEFVHLVNGSEIRLELKQANPVSCRVKLDHLDFGEAIADNSGGYFEDLGAEVHEE